MACARMKASRQGLAGRLFREADAKAGVPGESCREIVGRSADERRRTHPVLMPRFRMLLHAQSDIACSDEMMQDR